MNKYTAHLKHDNGRARVTVYAKNLEEATRQVLDVEKCPERAILFIGRTPTRRGIQQAKNWGY